MNNDTEWQDGDDSKLFDEGYSAGVIDAVTYLSLEYGGFSIGEVFSRLGVSND